MKRRSRSRYRWKGVARSSRATWPIEIITRIYVPSSFPWWKYHNFSNCNSDNLDESYARQLPSCVYRVSLICASVMARSYFATNDVWFLCEREFSLCNSMEIKKSRFEFAPVSIALTAFNLAKANFPPRSLSLSSGERSGSFVFTEQISQKRSTSSVARLHANRIANDSNQVVGNACSIMVSVKQHVRLASDFYLLIATEKTSMYEKIWIYNKKGYAFGGLRIISRRSLRREIYLDNR